MSKRMPKRKLPAGLPPIAAPIKEPAPEPEIPVTNETPPEHLEVEEEPYQLEQATVEAVLATCPRCGSTERGRLKEISPRIPTGRGLLIRYRTQCLGRINPVDRDGKPVVDTEGKPVSYECGNRYKVKAFVPNVRGKRGKAAS